MCWSAEVSLQSFLIGCGAILFAALSGRSPSAILFYASIVGMQLLEYIVWTYGLDSTIESRQINYDTSIAAAVLLAFQPVASIMASPYPLLPWYLGSVFVYLFLRYWFDKTPLVQQYRMEPEVVPQGEKAHLVWKWLSNNWITAIGLVIYFVFLLTPIALQGNRDLLIVVGSTLAFSLYSYGQGGTWGSMWCWMINWIVILLCVSVIPARYQ